MPSPTVPGRKDKERGHVLTANRDEARTPGPDRAAMDMDTGHALLRQHNRSIWMNPGVMLSQI